MILIHETTRFRAEQMIQSSPDPAYLEPGGQPLVDGFSLCVETGPFHFGNPVDYARGKARAFPDEGGPVILVVDVPEAVMQKALNDWFPLSQGLVQFDPGAGLEELLQVWPDLYKEIRSIP